MFRKLFIALFMAASLPVASFGQITTITGTGESLKIKLATAAATTEPTYAMSYRLGGTKSKIGLTTGGTAVTILTGVANDPALIDSLIVYNSDTAAVTVTIQKVAATVTYPLQSAVLPAGATMTWSYASGLRVTDSAGQSLTVAPSGLSTGTIGASTAAAGSTTSDAGVLPAGTAATYPTTAANGTTGVRVHATDKVTGRMLYIGNGVSNQILKVYAPSGGTINGASADAAFSSASGKGVIIQCLNSTSNTWLAW